MIMLIPKKIDLTQRRKGAKKDARKNLSSGYGL